MTLRLGPAILIVISFVAILLGIILHAISINELQYRSPPAKHFESNVIIDDKLEDLVWFLQVTDLHLSNRGNNDRITDFGEFAESYVDFVKPDVVLVTGDITDGRVPNTSFGTGQQREEWEAYQGAIKTAVSKTHWLDIRGNHDNFNVYRPRDPNTPFRNYSVQGKIYERNYMKIIPKDGKNYSFIGVDEVQTPGIKVFNFIGIVEEDDIIELKKLKDMSKQNNCQYNIWFAHYPTSSIASYGEGLRNIIDGPYLCGHFHTVGNWVLKMQATQQPGFAEVELGDWKHNRRLRLAAIDHQLFSLVDVPFRKLPLALMTNPKTAEHSMPKYEPVDRIINSTHIRVIAFSNATITSVEVEIDNEVRRSLKHSQGPLWVADWNPLNYMSGLHQARIFVSDSAGKSQMYQQSFSMDNSKEESSIGARILLRANFKSGVMSVFFFIVIVCTLPLLILRTLTYKHDESSLRRHYRGTFIYELHLLSGVGRLFWPLFMIPVWLSIGPNFVGYMVDDVIGVCFVWGILTDGRYIHTGMTYNIGSIFLLLVHVPVLILLTNQVSNSYRAIATNSVPVIGKLNILTYLVVTTLQLFMGSIIYSAQGTLALMTSFPFVWCIFIYIYCWKQCTTLRKGDFVKFNSENAEEQQALTGSRARDEKSSTSDHSSC